MSIDLSFGSSLQRPSTPRRRSNKLEPVYYHVSRGYNEIESFKPFTHFGVAQAALDRSKSSVFSDASDIRVYEVQLRLDPKRLLRMPDVTSSVRQNNHSIERLVDTLHYTRRKITSAERDLVFMAKGRAPDNPDAGFNALAGILLEHGFDGIIYANDFEAPGTDSIMILMPDQVSIVQIMPLSRLAEICESRTPATSPDILLEDGIKKRRVRPG